MAPRTSGPGSPGIGSRCAEGGTAPRTWVPCDWLWVPRGWHSPRDLGPLQSNLPWWMKPSWVLSTRDKPTPSTQDPRLPPFKEGGTLPHLGHLCRMGQPRQVELEAWTGWRMPGILVTSREVTGMQRWPREAEVWRGQGQPAGSGCTWA